MLGRSILGQWIRERPVVLVVEDEILTRMDTADIVRSAGYEVVEASNADEAIDILQSGLEIDVVFTDVQMPGSMDGLRLATAVRDRWPPIKIITASGRIRIRDEDLPSGSRFLPKPYSARDVVAHLRELTGFGSGARSI